MLVAKKEVPKRNRCAEDGSAMSFGFAFDSEVNATEAVVCGISIPSTIGKAAGIVFLPAAGKEVVLCLPRVLHLFLVL
jgi:hypothetical protein